MKEKKKNPAKKILVIAAVLILVIAALLVLFREPADAPEAGVINTPEQTQAATEAELNPDTPATTEAPAEPDATVATDVPAETETSAVTKETEPEEIRNALGYPLVMEGGKLEIDNLFQYDGMNPDANLDEGKNIASIMLRNTSGAYLEEAKITLTLMDGSLLNFVVHDLPAGKTVMAFDVSNTPVEADAQCAAVSCEARWNSSIIPLPEGISVAVDGMAITVTNNTGRNISELVIYCRCPLDEEYFGGIAYQYTINNLSANASATVEAWDCILGMAEVVRIAENEE